MNYVRLVILTAAAAAATFGQSEARTAVFGLCQQVEVLSGSSAGNTKTCILRPIVGTAQVMTAVPAGQVLVIEDVTAGCNKRPSDQISSLSFDAGVLKNLPLTARATLSNGNVVYSSSQLVKMHVPPGDTVTARVFLAQQATGLVTCGVQFNGYLASVQ